MDFGKKDAMTMKARMLEAVKDLPAGAAIEDAMERFLFLAKIEKGDSAGRCRRNHFSW